MCKVWKLDEKIGGWYPMVNQRTNEELIFATKIEAKKFVEEYPRFGCDYSRRIRNGNWQIVGDQK